MITKSNVLFFSPDTFGYYKIITGALEKMGHKVDWHNNIPSANIFTRVIFRLFPKVGKWYSVFYFNRKINWNTAYNNIIVIKGEGVDVSIIKRLRQEYKNAHMVIYNWDSIINNPTFLEKRPFFDKAFTFDFLDAESYSDMPYLSLFYNQTDHSNLDSSTPKKYAGIFVGTLHSDRYRLIEAIISKLDLITNKPSFCYYYYPNKFLYFFLAILKKNYGVAKGKVKFKAMTQAEIAQIITQSELVIDIVHEKQSGLTMRTIEAIGARKKIITNNKFIKNSNLFHPNNIFVIENLDMNGLAEFIASNYYEFDKEIYADLSVEAWASKLL